MLQAPREALGVLESAREFVVTAGGEIELNNHQMDKPGQGEAYPMVSPENTAKIYFLFGKTTPKTRYGHGNPPDSKRLVDGHLPMVIVPFALAGVEYRQTLFAWSEGMDPDGRLWAYVGLEMKNPTAAAVHVELAQQAVCGKRQLCVPLGDWEYDLAPGQQRRLCLRIPRDGIVPDKEITQDSPEYQKRSHYAELPFCGGFQGVEPVEPPDFDRCLQEAAQAWRQRLARGTTIRVPEPQVNDAYRAWLGYLFTNVDKEGERYFPHDGSGFYELVWGIAAIQSCRAFDMYGYPAEAQQYLDSICTLVRPDGELKTAFGLSDSGTLLVALEDHYRYTQDKAWLGCAADTIGRVANWSIARRAKEKEGQTPGAPNYGMIKYQPSGDYPEPDYSFSVGHRVVHGAGGGARCLRTVGREADARRVAAEAAAYRQDIEAAMRRSVFEHEGQRLLPILPASRAWLVRAQLWLDRLLQPVRRPDPGQRVPPGQRSPCRTAGRAPWSNAAGCARACARSSTISTTASPTATGSKCSNAASRRRRSSGCTARMAYGMSRTTYSGVECTRIETGANARTLPHLRSGTQQLRLLRMMLVREEGERLILAQAAPQHWLKQGQRVEVQDAPTMFGPVSYTIQSAVDQGRVTVQLTPPRRNPPQEIQALRASPRGQADPAGAGRRQAARWRSTPAR